MGTTDGVGLFSLTIGQEALRRRVAVLRFEAARRAVLPFAEARGYLTDEDVFRDVS